MATQLDEVRGRADWRRVEHLYRQFSRFASDEKRTTLPQPEIPGSLAEHMSRTFAHYDGIEPVFIDDLLVVLSTIDELPGSREAVFGSLYRDARLDRFPAYALAADRRRPKPFEAGVETVRRLYALNRVRDELIGLPTSGVLGGSVSYGRFFNTCGAFADKASDTDLLLIVPDFSGLRDVIQRLERVPGLDAESLERMGDRLGVHDHLGEEHQPCIFSHKLRFWAQNEDPLLAGTETPGHYSLSFHALTLQMLDFVVLRDVPILEPDGSGEFTRDVWDYRDTHPGGIDHQKAFNGWDLEVTSPFDDVELGYVERVRVCHIESDRFYPGLHQNLLLPQFEIRWESPETRITLRLLGFRWKLLERLAEERRIRPYEIQRPSMSHTRSDHFAPHVRRRADRGAEG